MTVPPSDPSGNTVDPASGGDGKSVSLETYQKTLSAEKNAKQKARELQEQLDVINAQKNVENEQKLLDEKKHLEVIENLKKEKLELESRTKSLLQDRTDSRKLNSVLGLLQEKGVSLDGKYLGLLPLDKINIGDDGSIDLTSVATVVQEFQTEHPRLVAPAKAFLPSDKTGHNAGNISYEAWCKLPLKEKEDALRTGKYKPK
jgi:hypothetical protein